MIGTRIRTLREKVGLNQEELARLLELKPQSVQQWESGKTSPRGPRIRKLASILATTPHYLMFGIGDDESSNSQDLLSSIEFKEMLQQSFAKSVNLAITLGWINIKRSDISLGMISDLMYKQLLDDYGMQLDPEDDSDQEKQA